MATASPLTDLATVLQTMFLGGSKSSSEVSNTKSSADAGVISKIQQVMDEALANSANPDAVKPIVDKIIKDATIAFAPNLAREAAGGMYNSSVKQMLSSQAAGDAAGSAANAVLTYKTNQQQIANQAGSTLVNATKSTSTTGGNKAATNPALPGGVSNLALGGLGLYSAYKNKDKLLNWLTGGSAASELPNVQIGAGSPIYDAVLGNDFAMSQAMLDPQLAPFIQGANDITGSLDFITGHGGVAEPATETLTHIFDNIGEYVPLDFGDLGIKVAEDVGTEVAGWAGDAIDVTGDIADFAGSAVDITDFLSGIGDFAGGIFDEILSFF